jgi:hypothetical protein
MREERKRAAAKLTPWTVRAYYVGFHTEYDRLLFKIAGKSSDGSGMFFDSHERDHDWSFKTESKARDVAMQLVSLPGIKRVTIEGNLTEEQEIEYAFRPEEPVATRRRRRRLRRRAAGLPPLRRKDGRWVRPRTKK